MSRFLELLDGGAEDEQLVVDHAHHRANDFIPDQGMLGAEVEQGDRHVNAEGGRRTGRWQNGEESKSAMPQRLIQ